MARRLGPFAVLLAPVLVVVLSFWPGHLSNDSFAQMGQADSGDFTNQHSALLAALWYLPYNHLDAGPGWVLVAQVATFVLGAYLVARVAFGRWGAAITAAALSLSPMLVGPLGYVSRDTWFTSLTLLTFGLVVRAAQGPPERRTRHLVLAAVAGWLALASRQNAAAAIVLAAIGAAAVLLATKPWTGRRKALTAAGAGVAVTLVAMGTQVAAGAALGVKDVHPEQYLFFYDLEQLSKREGENLFPASVMPERGMAPVDRAFSEDSMAGLTWVADPPIPSTPIDERRFAALQDAWRDQVTGDPVDYLKERTEMWVGQIALDQPALWKYHPQIDPNGLGYRIRFTGLHDAMTDYVDAFGSGQANQGGLLHRIWLYLLVAGAAAVVLLRRAGPSTGLLVVGLLAAACWTHQAGLFFGTPVVEFRFQVLVVAAALLAAVVGVRMALRARATEPVTAPRPTTTPAVSPGA